MHGDFVLSQFVSRGADMQSVPEEWREGRDEGMGEMLVKRRGDSECSSGEMKGEWKKNAGTGGEELEKETLMMELTRMVQRMVKESSWWERRGIDCSILAAAFLCLPPGKTSFSCCITSFVMVKKS